MNNKGTGSVPLLFPDGINRFSHDVTQIRCEYIFGNEHEKANKVHENGKLVPVIAVVFKLVTFDTVLFLGVSFRIP